MPSSIIRPAMPDDLPAITAIYAEAVLYGTATFELIPPDLAEMTRRYEALTVADFPYLVAETRDSLQAPGLIDGYAYAGPHRPRPAYRFTVENSIYLAPRAQHRGIGFALLDGLLAACEPRGYRQIIAVIGDSANAGSIAVHRKAGFALIGTHQNVGLKFGRWLDTVMMQRAIGEGSDTVPE